MDLHLFPGSTASSGLWLFWNSNGERQRQDTLLPATAARQICSAGTHGEWPSIHKWHAPNEWLCIEAIIDMLFLGMHRLAYSLGLHKLQITNWCFSFMIAIRKGHAAKIQERG
jgi:hypothetical protein